jgi:hypothetical protein
MLICLGCGLLLSLAGIFDWKIILYLNFRAEVMIELFGYKVYRAIYIVLGIMLMLYAVGTFIIMI